MENLRPNRKGNRKKNPGFLQKIFSRSANQPQEVEDPDWVLDSMDGRFNRIYSAVIIFHVLAVTGILAYQMLGKAGSPAWNSVAQAGTKPSRATATEKIVAGKALPVAPSHSQEDRYCVLAGDSLSTIAARLNVTTQQLCQTNHITSPDELLPGMWLKIPTPVVIDQTRQSADYKNVTQPPSPAPSTGELLYPVRKGDTAWGISQKFKINTHDLLEYNQIDRVGRLQIGQILKIPRK
jgi:LysM repeat protein